MLFVFLSVRDKLSYVLLIIWLNLFLSADGQNSINHWETVVNAEDLWSYRLGTSAPPADWMTPDFDDSSWQTGPGGIGYGDGDDNTVIQPTHSICMRINLELIDTSKIEMAILHADYDDAFVAYLNGVEIGRGNIAIGDPPLEYDESPDIDQEALLYEGGLPEEYPIYPPILDQLIQEGENTLAIQVNNYLITSSDLSSNFFLSLGINDESDDYGPTPEWFFEPFESTHLPLIRIHTLGEEIEDEQRILANMQIVNNGAVEENSIFDEATDYNGQISIEVRGNSSLFFDKKSYSFETQTSFGENNNVALLGMPPENDWVLHGPYSDKSLIRNALTYGIALETMEYAPRTRFCELIINDNYRGLYVLTEKIKRDDSRLDLATVLPEDLSGDELTGGYIIKIDWDDSDGDEEGWYSSYGTYPHYAYHHPAHDQLMPEQKIYIREWMLDFEEAMFLPSYASSYQNYVDVPSFIDYFLINEFAKHIDAFKLSFYMYKRKNSNGGKLFMGPVWDINLGFNNFDFACDPDPQGWIYPCTSSAFWVDKLLTIDEVNDEMYCRWQQLRNGVFATEDVHSRIDSLVDEMGPATDRNFDRYNILGEYVWPNVFIAETHEEEIDFLKTWIEQRLIWMDMNMFGNSTANCGEILHTSNSIVENQIEVYPNPFFDRVTFSYNGKENPSGEITLYDLIGHQIKRFTLSDQHTLTFSGLPAGIYLFEYSEDGKQIHYGKLVKGKP